MAISRRRKISLLGFLSILGGAAAIGSVFYPFPWTGAAPYGLGMVGIVLGVLALLNAYVLGHTGRVMPLLGLLLSGGAVAWAASQGQQSDRVTRQYDAITRAYRDHAEGVPDSAASQAAQPEGTGHVAAPPDNQRIGQGTIFDSAPGSSDSGGTPKPNAIFGNTASPAVASPSLNSGADPAAQVASAQSAVNAAKAKWDASISKLMPALSQTTAYQSANAAVQSAEVSLKSARATSNPGSADLAEASGRWVDAKSVLQKIIDNAARADPAATSARQEWLAAETRLSAVRAQLLNETNAGKTKPKPSH